jgi:hypothetical protein
MNLDRYMDDFGRELSRARPRRARAPLAVAAVAALGAAVAFFPSGNGGVDAVAQAREALAPTGEIVHMVVSMRIGGRAMGPSTEQWYAADPVRWRTVSKIVPAGAGGRPPKQFAWLELAFHHGRVRVYDAQRDVVNIWPDGRASRGLSPGILGGDPATDLREMLAAGDVRDDGVVTVDGRQVRRLVAEPKSSGPPRRLVYYMDPQTFAPIGGRTYYLFKARRMAPLEFKVERYERLPITPQNEQLLRFDKTPKTRHVWR